ncbi:MAG: hypothetical protein HY325_04740 [Chloroflexi bacterium]|nr:hypothetical protein [Chloroflexota bacterium]
MGQIKINMVGMGISRLLKITWHNRHKGIKLVVVLVLAATLAGCLPGASLPGGDGKTGADSHIGDYGRFDEAASLEELKLKQINPQTYAFKSLADDVIEIGSEKDSPPRPYLKLNRWGEAASLKVDFSLPGQAGFSLSENRLNWTSDKSGIAFYPVEPVEIEAEGYKFIQNEMGGVEFDVILAEKPATNKIAFAIETGGLRFYYQPPLTEPEKAAGAVRPENVVGSYAVYYQAEEGGQDKRGKAFHIYRPKVYDANGNEIWGELNIDETAGTLSITVDRDWLDKAAYPVTIDPTFGYTTIGGTSQLVFNDNKRGSKFTLSETGRVQSLTFYGSTGGGAQSPFVVKMMVYSDSAGAPNALLGTTAEITISSTDQWRTASFTSPISLAAGSYWLVNHHGTRVDMFYDTGTTNQAAANADTYSDGPSDPFGTPTYTARQYSIYATYISWESYQDAAHTVPDDLFDASGDIVYMNGLGFQASNNYAVTYYDGNVSGGGQKVATDSGLIAGASGNLSSQYLLNTDTAATAGTWHAVAFDEDLLPGGGPPTNYSDAATTTGFVTDDSFEVTVAAIPEFPSIIASIVVAGLCFVIYYWMRKRQVAYVQA